MPDRYHIKTVPTPGRFYRVGKFGEVDWREDCSRCFDCVKLKCCFDVYKHETEHNRDPRTATQPLYECKACMSCVQGCTKGLLTLSINPEYLDMGDAYWKSDILFTTWNQADTGKIPVSGAGYRGLFHGFGFDSIWTDMSEIVRPTRDGIHGREYISTSVDVGPKPMRLSFSEGRLLETPVQVIELPIPMVLDLPPWHIPDPALAQVRAAAAKELETLAVVTAKDATTITPEMLPFVVPVLTAADVAASATSTVIKAVKMVELDDSAATAATVAAVKALNPAVVIAARLTLVPDIGKRLIELAQQDVKVLHLCADLHGCEVLAGGESGKHLKDALREIHGQLVAAGMRDAVTVIATGGIALAEHMAKAIICGADVVGVGTAQLVALGCRVCAGAHKLTVHGATADDSAATDTAATCAECPAEIDALTDRNYAMWRIVNLMGAWHNQLLEVLGAMGIREVRRLRGEMGRAIFMEDIEKEAFGDLMRVPETVVR